MRDAVILVGARRAALAAAARLGLEVLVIDVARPRGAAALAVSADAVDDVAEHALDTARRELDRRSSRPRAVVALTEAAVVPAARVREGLGIMGMGVAPARRFTDKRIMKRAAEAAGVAVTPWRALTGGEDAAQLVRELGLPLVLKLARTSGSRGQVIARTQEEVRAALPAAALAERFVFGREMSLETLVIGGAAVFLNPTEYLVPLHASVVAAPPDEESFEAARELSARVLEAFELERGMAHLELFLTEQGPVLGEVAARPPGGRLMPLLWRAWGFDPWEALLRIELGEEVALPRAPRRCAGAYMLHPGSGRVREIEGVAEARAVPGVTRVRLRVEPGQRVSARLGSGEDVGYLQAEGESRDLVAGALLEAHGRLWISMED